MAKQTVPKLLRLIFQARYKPDLAYFSLASSAAAKFLNDYPKWRQDANHSLSLFDFEHRCILSINQESFSYMQDSDDLTFAISRTNRIMQELPQALNVSRYNRLGLRHLFIVPVDMKFESLAAVMTANLYIQTNPLRNALPQRIDDLLYRIDGSEGDRKFHVTIAPIHREEISAKIVNLANGGTIDPENMQETIRRTEAGYPPVAIFYDIDIYSEADQIGSDSASGFLKIAGERASRMVNETTDFLLAKMIRTA